LLLLDFLQVHCELSSWFVANTINWILWFLLQRMVYWIKQLRIFDEAGTWRSRLLLTFLKMENKHQSFGAKKIELHFKMQFVFLCLKMLSFLN
jgi:hypothetical protein